MSFVPSPQQAAFIHEAKTGTSSVVLIAVAGAGKTTTILQAVPQMRGSSIILAFNKKIAEELKNKLKRDGVDWKKAEASTVHAIGLRNYRKSFPKNRVVADKVGNICSGKCESGRIGPELMPHTSIICKLVSLAKQNAFGIIGDIDDTSIWMDIVDHFDLFDEEPIQKKGDDIIEMAIEVLKESNSDSEIIDFDDMIYLPLLYRIKFWQYDNVLMDEAQDANIVRKLMADALLKEGGRFFGIGDPCQPAGTQVSTPVFNSRWKANEPATVAIEALKVGDKVVSYEPADSAFVMNGRNVNGITVKGYDGDLIKVTDETGRVSRYTLHHRCLVKDEGLRDKFAVYLMRKGNQFRIGKCKMEYAQASGPVARMRHEEADAVWILSLHASEEEAYFREQAISGRFGLPQLMFSAKKMMRGPAASYLPEAWDFIGNNSVNAERCLMHFRLHSRYPMFDSSQEYISLKRPMIIRAINLMDGMRMLPFQGTSNVSKSDWTEVTVKREAYNGDVISLDVDGSKLYVADGLVTHNCQAIYGFTGADNDSMDNLKAYFECKEMPLTVTYRCPKSVVRFAQAWVSHIQAHPTAPEGSLSLETFEQMVQNRDRLNQDAAILCRNTRPLVTAAFALIREKIPCRIEGRDIGEALKKLALRWKSIQTIAELEEKLEEWLERETEKWTAKKKFARVQEAEDKVETLKVVMDACRQEGNNEINHVVTYLDNIFADNVSGLLTLSTIHRSKGREFKRVYWLDRFNTCPSRYATQDWEKQQENNLCYVAATRAMEELIDLFPPLPKGQPANENNKPDASKAA